MGDDVNGVLDSETCRAAAAILDGQALEAAERRDEADGLLAALDYRAGDDDGIARNRSALLRLAGGLQRLFVISPPDAPNMIFVGGETASDPAASLSGAGITLGDAFERCVGEAAEYLSQIAQDADIKVRGRPSEVAHHLEPQALSGMLAMLAATDDAADPNCDWVAGRRLADSAAVRIPADLCLRRRHHSGGTQPVFNVGSGCAAGPTIEAATVSALLEVIERDAAALWWEGGRQPRPISLEDGAAAGADGLLGRLRGGAANRRSRLLDLTTDLGVPCVAAVSFETDGSGFACGLGAGRTLASAIRSSVLEMCQMELSHQVIALKRRQRGDDALNVHDRKHLARGQAIRADNPLVQPVGPSNDWMTSSERAADPPMELGDIVDRLGELGAGVYAMDCTREAFSIPVARVLAIGLQPYPSTLVTSRLRTAIDKSGRSNASKPDVPLL